MSNILDKIAVPKNYGRAIPIIAGETISSFRKEKRFYISIIYYIVLPILLVLVGSGAEVIQTGNGIAIYYAQLNTSFFIKTLFLTFFPGQIFLVILSSDQIAGEVETDTITLVLNKPVYHSEVIIGKFLGLLSIISFLQIPSLSFIYYFNLIRYDADFPFAFWSSFDEVVAMFVLLFIVQSMILALSLAISSYFERSLYAILTSILSLFILSSISNNVGSNPDNVNYFSLTYYIDAVLPEFFFNLEKLDPLPNLYLIWIVMVLVILWLLSLSTILLRNRELF